MTETSIKNAIIKALRKEGLFCWRAGASPYQRSGVADILGVCKGRIIAFEVKTPEAINRSNKGLTENQKFFLDEINRHEGFGFVVSSAAQAVAIALDIRDHLLLGQYESFEEE